MLKIRSHQLRASYLISSFLLLAAVAADAAVGLEQEESPANCDFERYISGCFSQANFECDTETNKCRCQALTPILIDNHLCVKRIKLNESCRYSAQCDNERGIHCYAWPPGGEYAECGPQEPSCRCLSDLSEGDKPPSPDESRPEGSQAGKGLRAHKQTFAVHRQHNSLAHSGHLHQSRQQQQQQQQHQQQHHQQNNKPSESERYNSQSHYSLAPILSRFVWIFLILVLLILISLLVLINTQSFRTVDRPLNRAEDQASVNSELDVPPSYEVAIRMKL